MTRIAVDPAGVVLLGKQLTAIAGDLAALPGQASADEGFAPGQTPGALDAVLGNWLYRRGQLAKQLAALGDLARVAGQAYVVVEQDTTEAFTRGGRGR